MDCATFLLPDHTGCFFSHFYKVGGDHTNAFMKQFFELGVIVGKNTKILAQP